ncbi:hypothetical protein [Pseudorhodobacter ferrugineus]|uniref:hypothetical protein n=1 Tax=Pseudorhodobacter ferrugineus TaxID=77008 RepID=UPI0003B432E6|nr:hypothetical protein [Pseudorhodobacter ferrugineus]
MPARVIISLILIVITAAGLTIAAAQIFGLPMAVLGLVFAGAALGLRLWMGRK